MRIKSYRPLTLASVCLTIATVLTACSDTPTNPRHPDAPRLEASSAGEAFYSMGTASDRLAQQIPGFGGAYVDGGVLNIYLRKDAYGVPAAEDAARAAISALFREGSRRELPVRFKEARFSFIQLRHWEARLRQSFARLGVHTAGVDERNNRLRLTVHTSGEMTSVLNEAASKNIPNEAVETRVGAEGQAYTALTDKVRPARGGLYILTMFSYGGFNYRYACTYGFNAQISGSATRYMVTNAHCVQPSSTFGGLIGATVAQPDSQTSSLVGNVVSNPYSFTGFPCPAGYQCRNSDAVLVEATGLSASNWDLGGIARTQSYGFGPRSNGSLTLDNSNPRFALAGSSYFFTGDTLQKVGARTGWTAGVVTSTCTFHSSGSFGRLCDGVVAAGANHGDSGSPVFWQSGSGSYYLMGILWGGPDATDTQNSSEFWFSKWDNIKYDLSPSQPLIVN
ncbi:MAG TPA: hypothetical protein VFQ38_20560 [Longimicrobiales bacterium]|nr:hypothetical protein [Longimicrobiales bacterium]